MLISLLKKILRNRSPDKKQDSQEAATHGHDFDDGFGSFPSNYSLCALKSDCTASLLDDVQVLTRFCVAEKPYWHAFVAHYQRLGAKRIHACVQNASEEQWLASQESCQAETPFVVPHRVESVPPDVALGALI